LRRTVITEVSEVVPSPAVTRGRTAMTSSRIAFNPAAAKLMAVPAGSLSWNQLALSRVPSTMQVPPAPNVPVTWMVRWPDPA